MSNGRASAASDRLPWLDDEPKGSKGMSTTGLRRWAPWLALTVAGVAAGAYWLGHETGSREDIVDRPAVVADIGKAETTMSLPDATKAVEEVAAAAPPQAVAEAQTRKPAAPPAVRHGRVVIRKPAETQPKQQDEASDKPEYWPAATSAGASGRMVRIGTFASRTAAKKGWRAVMGIYPGMNRIPTTVVAAPSARDGKTYYRLQMGTTSQAHSEVLCQRMKIIGQSCVVVGLGEAAR